MNSLCQRTGESELTKLFDLFLNLSDGFNYWCKSYKDKLLLIRDFGE